MLQTVTIMIYSILLIEYCDQCARADRPINAERVTVRDIQI
jgi:hypothetical protein